MTQFTDNQTAPIGHNSRSHDVERTADEIRAQFLVTHAGWGSSEHWRMLYPVLLNPKLSDAAKVQYALLLPERKNFAWGNERTSKFTGKTPRTVERLFGELETEGYIKSTRRRNKPSSRAFLAPKDSIIVAAEELLERLVILNGETTNLSLEECETTNLSLADNRETTNLSVRNDRNVALPLSSFTLVEEEEANTGEAASSWFAGKEQAKVECSSSVALNGQASACLAEETQLQRVGLIRTCSVQ